MANVYTNIQSKISASGSDVDMYESPDATTSIVKTIKLYNTHGSALSVTIKVYDSSSTTDYEWDTVSVDASNSVDLLTFNNVLVLEAGDKIQLQASQANAITMTASVLQTSRT